MWKLRIISAFAFMEKKINHGYDSQGRLVPVKNNYFTNCATSKKRQQLKNK